MSESNWPTVSLLKVVSLRRGFDLPEPIRVSGRYPVLGSSGVSGWHNVGPIIGPGVTIGRSGSSIGVATYTECDYWPLNTTLYVEDFHGNDPSYVYHLLKTIDFAAYNSGSAQPSLNRNFLSQIGVPLPGLESQRGISRLLGALDDKILANERIVDTALALARLRYAAVIADQGHVSQLSIGEVADLFDGPHATPKKTEYGPWFLSIGSLNQGFLDLDSSAHLSDEDFIRWTRRITPCVGDVLFSYETRLGVASLMPSGVRACLGRRMALMRPIDNRVGSATLLHAYLADEFQETIRKRTIHGATVDRIPLTDLPSWTITLPLPKYRPIVESTLSALHHTIEARQRENRVLAELRDALLPKLISGELRVRDAERQVADVV